MTAKQRREHKFGNAIRAWKGGMYSAPQKMAESRVKLWAFRIKALGQSLPKVFYFKAP